MTTHTAEVTGGPIPETPTATRLSAASTPGATDAATNAAGNGPAWTLHSVGRDPDSTDRTRCGLCGAMHRAVMACPDCAGVA